MTNNSATPAPLKVPVSLKIVVEDGPHTRLLKSGKVPVEGVDLDFVEVKPVIGAFRRMVRDLEFDLCEVAPVTYMLARAQGVPITALPIFLYRRFHHGDIVCQPESGIGTPADLDGRRVGVRAYSVTTGVWKRGIMSQQWGLDLSHVTWVIDDEEAVPNLSLPSNVERVHPSQTLAALFAAGELDAAFTGPAGIGRAGPPAADWNNTGAPPPSEAYELFTDGARQAEALYNSEGIYPFHGVLVVKNSVLDEHPWLARSLFDAFTAAKAPLLDGIALGRTDDPDIVRYRELSKVVGPDPLPYGISRNRTSIEALRRFVLEQGLVADCPSVEELFVPLD